MRYLKIIYFYDDDDSDDDMYVCVACIWKSEDNSVKSVLFFHLYLGSKDQTQVMGLLLQAL